MEIGGDGSLADAGRSTGSPRRTSAPSTGGRRPLPRRGESMTTASEDPRQRLILALDVTINAGPRHGAAHRGLGGHLQGRPAAFVAEGPDLVRELVAEAPAFFDPAHDIPNTVLAAARQGMKASAPPCSRCTAPTAPGADQPWGGPASSCAPRSAWPNRSHAGRAFTVLTSMSDADLHGIGAAAAPAGRSWPAWPGRAGSRAASSPRCRRRRPRSGRVYADAFIVTPGSGRPAPTPATSPASPRRAMPRRRRLRHRRGWPILRAPDPGEAAAAILAEIRWWGLAG